MLSRADSKVPPEVDALVTECIGVAIAVHRELGPGFREVIYRRAYCLELDSRAIRFECEKPVLVRYKTWQIPGQRLDLLVEGKLVIEIKALPRLATLHEQQLLSYLKATRVPVGLLLNFNTSLLRQGLRRVIL